jgi:hypothetical protein
VSRFAVPPSSACPGKPGSTKPGEFSKGTFGEFTPGTHTCLRFWLAARQKRRDFMQFVARCDSGGGARAAEQLAVAECASSAQCSALSSASRSSRRHSIPARKKTCTSSPLGRDWRLPRPLKLCPRGGFAKCANETRTTAVASISTPPPYQLE